MKSYNCFISEVVCAFFGITQQSSHWMLGCVTCPKQGTKRISFLIISSGRVSLPYINRQIKGQNITQVILGDGPMPYTLKRIQFLFMLRKIDAVYKALTLFFCSFFIYKCHNSCCIHEVLINSLSADQYKLLGFLSLFQFSFFCRFLLLPSFHFRGIDFNLFLFSLLVPFTSIHVSFVIHNNQFVLK